MKTISDSSACASQLATDLQEARSACEASEERAQQLHNELEEARSTLTYMNKLLEALKTHKQATVAAKETLTRLQQDSEAQKQAIAGLERDRADRDAEIAHLMDENRDAKRILSEQAMKCEQLEQEVAEIRAEREAASDMYSAKRTEAERLLGELAAAKEGMSITAERLEKCEAEASGLRQILESKDAEIVELRERDVTAVSDMKDLRDRVQELERSNAKLVEVIADGNEALAGAQEAKDKLEKEWTAVSDALKLEICVLLERYSSLISYTHH
jgi:chromosome segregation ATPase